MSKFRKRFAGLARMLAARKAEASKHEAAVVYTGTWHDSIPRRLILDPHLQPVEKLVWQIIRTHISQPGEDGAWPSIARLARLANVSRPTIQNAIDVLEASRWISVLRRVRDEQGNVIGNYYMLHDAPLSVSETMVFNPLYLDRLRKMSEASGPSKVRVRKFAFWVMRDINYRPEVVQAEPHHSELRRMQENLEVNGSSSSILKQIIKDKVEQPAKVLVQAEPKAYSESKDDIELHFEWSPKLHESLRDQANKIAMRVSPHLRGVLVRNFNLKIENGGIRSPLSYLGALVKRIEDGTFIDVAGEKSSGYEHELSKKLAQAKAALDSGKTVMVKGRRVSDIFGMNISFVEEVSAGVHTVNAALAKLIANDIEIIGGDGQ